MKKILIICLLLILVTGCQKKEQKPTIVEIKPEEKIEELLKNSYIYSLYNIGNLTLSDAKVETDGKIYYYIEEKYVKNIDELNEMVSKVYLEDVFPTVFETHQGKKEFLLFDNELYVNNVEESCNIGKDYNFEDFQIIKETSDNLTISFNGKEYNVYIKDGKYYLDEIIFNCID